MNSKMDGNAFNDIGKTNNHLLFYKFSMINEILDKRIKKQNPEMKSITKGQGRLIALLKRKDKRVLLIELTEEGRNLKFKYPEDIDIFDTLSDEEKEILNDYFNRLILELHDKFMEENPEKYEKILKNRKEIFEKYFKNDKHHDEWVKLMGCNKKRRAG